MAYPMKAGYRRGVQPSGFQGPLPIRRPGTAPVRIPDMPVPANDNWVPIPEQESRVKIRKSARGGGGVGRILRRHPGWSILKTAQALIRHRPEQPGGVSYGDWILQKDCTGEFPDYWELGGALPGSPWPGNPICATGQPEPDPNSQFVFPANGLPMNVPRYRARGWKYTHTLGAINYGRFTQFLYREAIGESPQLLPPKRAIYGFAPDFEPDWDLLEALDPMVRQPLAPPGPIVPVPYRDIPLRQPHPLRAPGEQRQVGPAPAYRLANAWRIGQRVSIIPIGHIGVGPTVEIKPDTATRVIPPEHTQSRVDGRTKERKVVVLALRKGGYLDRVIGLTGEAADVINALWDAMPEHVIEAYPPGSLPTIQSKAFAIYDNFEELDLEQALQNLITNEIEDRVIGELGKLNARMSREAGFAAGWMLGGAARNQMFLDWYNS